jgi:selenocysteine-specific elongation factor
VRHLVVGTAGHIDHGKSALVEALTGTHPDRLKEERERGITIELGFADFEPAPNVVVSFVDVPGHERFVRHMVAGAAGIDAVLLVVAADEGVMPQTREHVRICALLGVRHGLVALSKSDLADAEVREVAALETHDFLRGTFLETAPVVPVSARTGEGLAELRAALAGLFATVSERPVTGVARLPVDRSFTMKGFGTVVTGTLVSGRLAEAEEVEILPGGRRARVRGLHVHHHKVAEVLAGRRTAVNLQGVDVADVPRGATVAHAGELLTTRRVWARVSWLPEAPEGLRRGGPVRFHQGTCERAARIRILEGPGEDECRAEIVLGEATVLVPGDRFILRRPAPVDTVGGGVVLDVRPPRGRRHPEADVREEGEDPILVRVRRAGLAGRERSEIMAELGVDRTEMEAREAQLETRGLLVRVGTRRVSGGAWEEAQRRTIEALEAFHAAEPLRAGIAREDLRARCAPALAPEAWRQFLQSLVAKGAIRLEAEFVASCSHRVILSVGDLEAAAAIEETFLRAGLDPPDIENVIDPRPGERAGRLVEWLVREGRLVKIRDGRLFHAEALADLRRKLAAFAKTSRTIDVGMFKELAGVTRKNAIPLLEQMDEEKTTRRVGNLREILCG